MIKYIIQLEVVLSCYMIDENCGDHKYNFIKDEVEDVVVSSYICTYTSVLLMKIQREKSTMAFYERFIHLFIDVYTSQHVGDFFLWAFWLIWSRSTVNTLFLQVEVSIEIDTKKK